MSQFRDESVAHLAASMLRARMRVAGLLALCVIAVGCAKPQQTKLGIDVLREDHFAMLKGKRVGLVVNPASVDGDRQPTVMVLKNAPGVNLVALYGVEHGVWGDEYAGDKVGDKVDPTTGLRVFSLYGKTRKPSAEMLKDIDVLVFDLQDIGSRSYTYISSMKAAMEGCIAADKPFVVLDRPNPLGGKRVEGPLVSKGYESFVSYLAVPYLHGMTMGELALMTRDELAPNWKGLTVVPMKDWHRDETWADTGLDWIPTSPHIPHVSSVAAYAATGVMGELYQVSNGVGYTQPFEIVGRPGLDGVELAGKLNQIWPGERGIYFRPIRFKPFYATNKLEPCGGVQVHLDPKTAPSLVEINYRLIEAIGGPEMMKKAQKPTTTPAPTQDGTTAGKETPPASEPSTTRAAATTKAKDATDAVPAAGRRDMFDKVTGDPEIGNVLAAGGDLGPVFAKWRKECEAFKARRAKYLLYR